MGEELSKFRSQSKCLSLRHIQTTASQLVAMPHSTFSTFLWRRFCFSFLLSPLSMAIIAHNDIDQAPDANVCVCLCARWRWYELKYCTYAMKCVRNTFSCGAANHKLICQIFLMLNPCAFARSFAAWSQPHTQQTAHGYKWNAAPSNRPNVEAHFVKRRC